MVLWSSKGQKHKGIYACMQQNRGQLRTIKTKENFRQENIGWDMAFWKRLTKPLLTACLCFNLLGSWVQQINLLLFYSKEDIVWA